MLRRSAVFAFCAFALASCDSGGTREIRVVGSSTVYPFTTAVAEAFVNKGGGRKAPVIESTGTGAGIKRFCEGVGSQYPDIVNASRRMKRSEYDDCRAHGVEAVMEVRIGVDGIVVAESNQGPKMALSEKDLYLALAANPMGKPNAAKTWKDVNPALPAIPIQVMGPPSTSGTRDAFAELVLERGCKEVSPDAGALQVKDSAAYENLCRRLRDDGAYVDKGENDNLIVQGLAQNPNALGIFGFSYAEENQDRIHGVAINGVKPDRESISTGKYPAGRALYIYVKHRHLNAVPGLQEFLDLYASMWGADGPLAKRGLIPMSESQQKTYLDVIQRGLALEPAELQ